MDTRSRSAEALRMEIELRDTTEADLPAIFRIRKDPLVVPPGLRIPLLPLVVPPVVLILPDAPAVVLPAPLAPLAPEPIELLPAEPAPEVVPNAPEVDPEREPVEPAVVLGVTAGSITSPGLIEPTPGVFTLPLVVLLEPTPVEPLAAAPEPEVIEPAEPVVGD